MLVAMMTFVRAYLPVKLTCVAIFIACTLILQWTRTEPFRLRLELVWFYLLTAMAGAAWGLVGLANPGNYAQGTLDSMKLYVVWSLAFLVLYSLLRSLAAFDVFHLSMVGAGIAIPAINLMALSDVLLGTGLVPAYVAEAMSLDIGFGDGFLQFSSENTISMFLVAPYLLTIQLRVDAAGRAGRPAKLALLLSLAYTVLSGRRALWLVVLLTPALILGLSLLTRGYRMLRPWGRRGLVGATLAGALGLTYVLHLPEDDLEAPVVTRIRQAFSAEDERSIQSPFLIDAFARNPILGAGFGAHAGYTRNEDRPWAYELTYQTMLFNLGLVGTTAVSCLYLLAFLRLVRGLRRSPAGSAVPFGLLVACLCLLVGAYSNPYLGGFDSLFFAGLLPFLSSYRRRFDAWSADGGGLPVASTH